MRASSLSFRAAVLFVIAGMIWGIIMGISENHVTMPAHAHLNLLGWVSLFLIGTYYRLNPAVERSRSATLQVSLPKIRSALDSLRQAESSHDAGRC